MIFSALILLACSGDTADVPGGGDVRDAVADADIEPATPRTARANAALMLGLRAEDGALSTFFIDPAGITPLGEGLLVPRQDGWWTLKQAGRSQGSWTEAFLATAPLGAEAAEPDSEDMSTCEGGQTVTVLFVGSNHVSTELSSGGYCEGAAHPFAWSGLRTVALDSLPDLLAGTEIGAVVGPMADEAFFLAGEAVRKSEGGECFEEPNPESWALIRKEGHWLARGALSYAIEVCRGQVAVYTVDAALPETLTGHDSLPQEWSVYKTANPALLDVLAAPDGSLEVHVTKDGLELRVNDAVVANHAAPGSAIVMSQWTVGDHNVDNWRSETAAALK